MTPAATAGCAIWRSNARGPAPSRSMASRLSRHASELGPYRPGSVIRGSFVGVSTRARYANGAKASPDSRWRDAGDGRWISLGQGLRSGRPRQSRDTDVEGVLPPPAGAAVRPPDPGAPCPGPGLLAASTPGKPAADPGRRRVREVIGRLRAVRARHRSRLPDPRPARPRRRRRPSRGTSCAGGWSVASWGWPRELQRARPSRICTPPCTTCRASASPRRAGCVGWRPKSAIGGRPTIPDGPTGNGALVLARSRPAPAGLISKSADGPRRAFVKGFPRTWSVRSDGSGQGAGEHASARTQGA